MEINYRLRCENGDEHEFAIKLDAKSLKLIEPAPKTLPEWTQLNVHQCLDCPLKDSDSPHCPAAISLVDLAEKFGYLQSHVKVHTEIDINEKTISADTTAQRALSSMVGLLMATSGCPNTEFLRPLTRFHIPLADEEETIYRSVSMYLLAQYFRLSEEQTPDLALSGLTHSYRILHRVNQSMADRLRTTNHEDAGVNAVILLDLFAKAMPCSIEKSLDELRYLFQPYLK